MQEQLTHLLQSAWSHGLVLALSFLDDGALLLATKVGVNLPWLSELATLLLTATLIYWAIKLLRILLPALLKQSSKPPFEG
jgi:hypothetical protein